MPQQIKSSYNEVIVPFSKMSFTPDVPPSALGPNEYNDGLNVEADVRGIRSVAGDEYILPPLPAGYDAPTFVTGGFRGDGKFWFIVAVQADGLGYGGWFASDGTTWHNITPITGDFTQYAQNTNITEAWNGTIPFFNDEHNPPMFWPDPTPTNPNPVMIMYSNQLPLDIKDIQPASATTRTIRVAGQATVPYVAGDLILINNVSPRYYNGGPFTVTACTTSYDVVNNQWNTFITYESTVTDAYLTGGTVSPAYAWNYTPEWYSVYAKFMRIFNSPNVGSILVAGNLTVTPVADVVGDVTNGSNIVLTTQAVSNWVGATVVSTYFPANTTITSVTPGVSFQTNNNCTITNGKLPIKLALDAIEVYPVTVRWSQAFGLQQAPLTWEPTVINVANELEVPLRGPALDAFPSNGQFYLCSYWDTVVFSPLNFATTNTPILGVRMFNQGRGMLSSNCWANTDKLVYGIDARDVWVFDGQNFTGLGNQRVKQYLFDKLAPEYYDRVFMDVNTQKNQIEIYYPDSNATGGVPNKMLSYRYDLDCWNAPRDVYNATFSCETPIWKPTERDYANVVTSTPLHVGTLATLDIGVRYYPTTVNHSLQYLISAINNPGTGYSVNDSVSVLGSLLGGGGTNNLIMTVTSIGPGGSITGLSIVSGTPDPNWNYAAGSRTIVYAQGIGQETQLLQKEQGYSFRSAPNIVGVPISSYFRRNNIKLLKDYSGKLMVHRILPEVVNLGATPFTGDDDRPINPAGADTHLGNVTVTLEGAGSVGAIPTVKPSITMATTTENPWCQFNQNAYRVNNIEISNISDRNIWMCNATTWQFTQVEDDR